MKFIWEALPVIDRRILRLQQDIADSRDPHRRNSARRVLLELERLREELFADRGTSKNAQVSNAGR